MTGRNEGRCAENQKDRRGRKGSGVRGRKGGREEGSMKVSKKKREKRERPLER